MNSSVPRRAGGWGPGLGVLAALLCTNLAQALAPPSRAPAQVVVYMRAGEGVKIFNADWKDGRSFSLGTRWPGSISGMSVTAQGEFCCDRVSGVQCLTERNVHLETSRKDLLSRYGAPRQRSDTELQYAGISFTVGRDGQVQRICVGTRR